MKLQDREKEILTALLSQAIPKAKERPEVEEELSLLLMKLEAPEEEEQYTLNLNLDVESMEYSQEVILRMEKLLETYVKHIDVNDIEALEKVKKELSAQLMYLSSYKDKFLYEVDHMEEVFKKELLSKMAHEISLRDRVSYTQAEKKVPSDDRYSKLREEVTEAKIFMSKVKTKYDFFSKMIQVIVQSISVAGKEQYSTRVSN